MWYPTGARFSTFHFHNLYARALLQECPHLPQVSSPLVLRLTLVSTAVDCTIRVLDKPEISMFGGNRSVRSHHLKVGHSSRTSLTPVPLVEIMPYYSEHLSALLDEGILPSPIV